jgi:uncharacterized protein
MNMTTPLDGLEKITSYAPFSDLKIIDMDTHWSEPMDLWSSRAPASLKNKVPRVMTKDGMANWVIGEEETVIQMASPLSVIGKDAKKIYGGEFFSSTFDEVHEASWDLTKRVQFMDAFGIHAQILYPNVGGIGFTYFRSQDKDLKTAVTQIYNDAAAEIQSDTNGRVLPMAVIPFWDIDHAVKEVERAMGMGLHGIVLGGDVHLADMPDLGQAYWNPLWELCESEQIPVNFHIGGSDLAALNMKNASWPTFGAEAYLALGSSVMYIENARVIGNLIYSGVPERFPKIQFVSVESGLGWLPFYLASLDYQLIETAPSEAVKLSLKPSEYFKRNFHASFWFETETVEASVEALGVDQVMFETDFPHPTCLYPGPLSYLKRSIGGMDAESQRKILQDNAAKLYKIPL